MLPAQDRELVHKRCPEKRLVYDLGKLALILTHATEAHGTWSLVS